MIITVGNIKGGTGKSTISYNLGLYRLHNDNAVVFVDLDPQQTTIDTIEVRKELGHDMSNIEFMDKIPQHFDQSKDYILDVSIADKEMLIKAIGCSDIVIVPCAPSQSDVWATEKFIDMIHLLYPKVKVYAFVNRADTNKSVKETTETADVLRTFKVNYIESMIYNRTAYRKSFSEGLAVFEMKGSQYNKAVNEFIDFAEELFGNVNANEK